MTLTDLFALSLVDRRNAIALEFEDQTLTFGEIDVRSNRMAHLFAERGLKPGDRLCVYLANCLEMIDIYLACVKSGVIFVPVNILYKEREIAHMLADAEPKAVVTEGNIPGIVDNWRPDELSRAAAAFPATRPAVVLDGDATAAIIYTSGTTGASKGAILSHNNFAANAVNLVTCWKISEADRFLLPLPLFHVHGLGNGLHTWLIAGCRMRLLRRFDREAATATFLNFRPTLFFGVPTIYVRLLETSPEAAREIGGCMRLFVSGLGATSGASARRVPRPVRPGYSGALRHDGDVHESQQSLRGRAPSRNRRFPVAWRVSQADRWRAVRSRPERVLRLLETGRCHASCVYGWLFPYGRPGRAE